MFSTENAAYRSAAQPARSDAARGTDFSIIVRAWAGLSVDGAGCGGGALAQLASNTHSDSRTPQRTRGLRKKRLTLDG